MARAFTQPPIRMGFRFSNRITNTDDERTLSQWYGLDNRFWSFELRAW